MRPGFQCNYQLSASVTHVVHNAWKVDFNHRLQSFEPLVAATRRLVDACYGFYHPVRLLFSSSISVSLGWDITCGPVPEELLGDPRLRPILDMERQSMLWKAWVFSPVDSWPYALTHTIRDRYSRRLAVRIYTPPLCASDRCVDQKTLGCGIHVIVYPSW